MEDTLLDVYTVYDAKIWKYTLQSVLSQTSTLQRVESVESFISVNVRYT